jgi:very-short-patch-repair endonuclease
MALFVNRKVHFQFRAFDSQFERDVYSLIVSRGYRVVPQVKIGTLGKRIDLVVEGMRTRLAVECDGDKWHGLEKWEEDMERQRLLERVGWTFWRVRGSAFYANPSKAMESLWTKFEDMGIEPNVLTNIGFGESRTSPAMKKEIVLKKTKRRTIKEIPEEKETNPNQVSLRMNSNKGKSPNSEQVNLFSLELEGLHKQLDMIDLMEEDMEGS